MIATSQENFFKRILELDYSASLPLSSGTVYGSSKLTSSGGYLYVLFNILSIFFFRFLVEQVKVCSNGGESVRDGVLVHFP